MFIVFVILCLIGLALIVGGIASLRRVQRPLPYVAVVGGFALGAASLLLLAITVQ